jgi:inorganic phosphate transporter, PiT family
MIILLAAMAMFLAFSNGANDNFKGFATSWGAGTLSYRPALILCTAATLAGGLASLYLAEGLLVQFSGKGLVPDELARTAPFGFAVAAGAGATVMLATRLGFPISTTHALVGGLTGAGLASGGAVSWGALGSGFMLPLLVSPILAASAGLILFAFAGWFATLKPKQAFASPGVRFDQPESPKPARDGAHIVSGVAICFARAVNDTPKLAALMLGAGALSASGSILATALTMVAGGWLLSRRVAETMSLRISEITPAQGIMANLVTATLVLSASKLGVPVSTTHVSVGSIIGTGAAAGRLDLSTVSSVLLSWVLTLPSAAVIGGCAAWLAA